MPRLRLPRPGAAVVLAALVLLLGACGGQAGQAQRAQRAGAGPTASADRGSALPRSGQCRDLRAADVAAASNATAVVACSAPHTAQTFAVGEFPAAVAAQGYDARALGRYTYTACGAAYLRFLGADESKALRSLLSWAWFRPSEQAWRDGEHWFRCDLVGGPADATTLRDLPETGRDFLAAAPPQQWMLCARGSRLAGSVQVPCAADHDWRAVTTIKLGEPKDAWPGARAAQTRSDAFCSDSVAAYLGYPAQDFDYGATTFGQAEWQSGNRRSVCWARMSG